MVKKVKLVLKERMEHKEQMVLKVLLVQKVK